MSPTSTALPKWMQALGQLRTWGWGYGQIASEIGASSRSVRRWDQYRVRVEEDAEPSPGREATPIPILATALVSLVQSKRPAD